MIRSFFEAVRERQWDRDRSRRIVEMERRERATLRARIGCLEAMALQLVEIRSLPEALEPRG